MATLGGPAHAVSVQTNGRQQGGPAVPVAVVTDGRAVQAGPAAPVYVVTSGPVQGGPAVPVVAAAGAVVAAGPAMPVYVVSGSLGGADPMAYTNKVKATASANLIGYWPLAEAAGATVAVDESGNGRNGAYKASGEPIAGQTGIGDGRTSDLFDGSNDFIDLYSASLAAAFNNGELTVAIWFKEATGALTDGTTDRAVVLQADASNRVTLGKSNVNNQCNGSYIAGGTTKSLNVTVSDTNWHFLALTVSKSADQVKVYLDGAQIGATATGLGVWAGALASATTCLGSASSTAPGNVHNGNLAHAMLWTTPLSAAQIAALAVVP